MPGKRQSRKPPNGPEDLARLADDGGPVHPEHDPPTRIYVCREAIERNIKEDGADFPPITVRHVDVTATWCRRVDINGPSVIKYSSEPLTDGTRVWLETTAPIKIHP